MTLVRKQILLRSAAIAIILWSVGFLLVVIGVPVVDVTVIGLGSIAGVVTWVIALLMAIQRQQWYWVILIAITSYLGALLYAAAKLDDTA